MAGFQSEDERMKYKYADRAGLIVGNKPQIDGTTGIDAYGNPVDPSVSGNMSRWTTCGFFGSFIIIFFLIVRQSGVPFGTRRFQ
jgi:hypothetical protein